MIEVDVPNNFGDIFWAIGSAFWRSPWLWGLLLLVNGPAAYQVVSGRAELGEYRSAGWSLLGLILLLFVLIPLFSAWRARTAKALQGPLRYQFSETGIDLNGSGVSGHYDWSNIYRVKETSSFLVYTSAVSALIVPKRCFQTDVDIASLRQLIQTHAPQKVKRQMK
jgi:hypothetical protein